MAEIQVLSVDPDLANAVRVAQILAKAVVEGRDLGPRVPHMQALGRTLSKLVEQLEQELAGIHRCAEGGPSEVTAVLRSLDALVDRVRELGALAEALPV